METMIKCTNCGLTGTLGNFCLDKGALSALKAYACVYDDGGIVSGCGAGGTLIEVATNPAPGLKLDQDKLPWDLMPWDALAEVMKVIHFGAQKYTPYNWQKVKPKSRYLAAAFRHLIAYQQGERDDPETGLSHLAHLACNALFLLWSDCHES